MSDDAVAGSVGIVGIGVEGMADTTSVAGAQSLREIAIRRHEALGDLADERVDTGEEGHKEYYSSLQMDILHAKKRSI